MNEILLVASLFVIYGCVLLAYRLFGKSGLYCFTAIATITANIEVLIMVKAFGMEQTLGNILFASTFLVTDIISEIEGKKRPRKRSTLGYSPRCFSSSSPSPGCCIIRQQATGRSRRSVRSSPIRRG